MNRIIMTHQQKYTLIELLVTISIIAIMASLLMSVMKVSMEKSRAATCAGNQKQLISGVFGYTEDNTNWLPIMETYGGGIYPWDETYIHEIAPYLGYESEVLSLPEYGNNDGQGLYHPSTRISTYDTVEAPAVLQCPSKSNPMRMAYSWNSVGLGTFANWADTPEEDDQPAVNNAWRRRQNLAGQAKYRDKQAARDPAEVFVFAENESDTEHLSYGRATLEASYKAHTRLGTRHDGDLNLIFLDGHQAQLNKLEMLIPSQAGGLGTLDWDGIGLLWWGTSDLP